MLRYNEIKPVKIPKYPELNVKEFWEVVKSHPGLIVYFPDYKTSQFPKRDYFFNLLFTLDSEFIIQKVEEANERREIKEGTDEEDMIEIQV